MNRPSIEVAWYWGSQWWYGEVLCITLNPILLKSITLKNTVVKQSWSLHGSEWINGSEERANDPFSEQLGLALQYFIQLEQDIEDVLLTGRDK